ncbi:capsular polysaccharide transport system permease protein [Epibacterium ulvae]|uniref:Capsular polysaccharide transport system permease protein n=1 Tax=Epibacterium ulvae TaxID=1156985 RepID=A0A1G5PVM7_9RHOB|nr:capsule biosynthesis protein [Epibacterium ulvae]SCZ53109.1 capsular polysaccharide transport system permease protein [Epibacterium ulvae]
MTMKPKAKKFRIRRNGNTPSSETPATAKAIEGPQAEQVSPSEADSPKAAGNDKGAQLKMAAALRDPQERSMDTDIEVIKREGLTGRQLRMARRLAQKHGLSATSDFDAVRLLRTKGIDPFKHANMLELVVPKNTAQPEGNPEAPAAVQLPQTLPTAKSSLPSTELSPAERRTKEIKAIQEDIARRRRKKLALLVGRLSFFVLIPTLAAGIYFTKIATPMYSSKSEFLVLTADGGGGAGGLLSGTQFATSQDSIAVQGYLESKEAMLRLDNEIGFRTHFTQEWIDPIQRLDSEATNEDVFKAYTRNINIGYDPTEGVIRMEVSAADPEIAAEFSRKLISYAQERVNNLSSQKRSDQLSESETALEQAESQRRDAQEHLVRLQQQGSVLDPEGVIASLRSQIGTFELQLQEKQLELAALVDNSRPNRAKVAGVEGDISRLEAVIANLNARMQDASAGENSLANLRVQIQMAQMDLATRDLMLQAALEQRQTTQMEANRQVRYLTTHVEPVASEEPSYPRKFENTILAFLVFSGIYLMCSLTASILREQVSS